MAKLIWLSFLLLPNRLANPYLGEELIVWNVGQGQWVTYSSPTHCLHFDMGGERFPVKSHTVCKDKKNLIFLSHADLDHVSFMKSFVLSQYKSTCFFGKLRDHRKKWINQLIDRISPCSDSLKVTEIKWIDRTHSSLPNALSRVFVFRNFLIPGDSPIKQERLWINNLPHNHKIKFLILGHHGSRTSTSDDLLHKLPHLKLAIASSRKSRYGHPHSTVIKKLKKRKTPLLITEQWGHIHFLKGQ